MGGQGGTHKSLASSTDSQAQVWLLYRLGKPLESWFCHPQLLLLGASGSDRHPCSKRLRLSLPGSPGISLKHFAAPQWLPEEKQGLVLQARSRRMCGLRFAGRIWPLAFVSGSSWITPDHPLPQPPAVPFSPATVVSQTLFTCLLETTPVPPRPRAFSRVSEGRDTPPETSPSGLSSSKFPGICAVPFPGLTFLVHD